MPHSVSAKKRLRQNVRNRERNRAAKSEIKTV
ncbi:MAG: 30S ribosomal protein S20, partial [Planctomycetota bacterium]